MAVTNPTSKCPYISGTTHSSLARVAFRCQFVTDAAPDNVLPAGLATTPLRSSEGVYSVVIADYLKLPVLISAQACLLGAAGTTDGRVVSIVSYTASTGVLVFNTYSLAATPALADIANDEWVMFDLVFAQDGAGDGASGALA
jgi:hypothetical protein